MSLASKITFGVCCTVTISIIGYVHIKQEYERDQLHAGVVRDLERQERRKIENLYALQQQNELTKQLRRESEINNNS